MTLVGALDDTDIVSGSGGRTNLSDKDLVEAVLRELSEAADKWEALLAQAETVTYSVDLGDIQAVANSDGRLLKLTLHPGVTTSYAHGPIVDLRRSPLFACGNCSGRRAGGSLRDLEGHWSILCGAWRHIQQNDEKAKGYP